MNKVQIIFLIAILLMSCKENSKQKNTFEKDLEILQNIEDLIILKNNEAMIAVSGAYQGRVFTSSSNGLKGKSYGYFNKALIKQGNSNNNLAGLGGESRMWFGPQFGKFSVFFELNSPQTDENIIISPDLNSVLFELIEKDDESITYGSNLKIRNSNSYVFDLKAKRKITIKSTEKIKKELDINLNEYIKSVAFSAETWIQNIGKTQWSKEQGLLSIWDLGCQNTSPNTVVIIPTRNNLKTVTNYFTPLEKDRIKIQNNVVFYKADALYMNKIGILPENCMDMYGSYSPELNLLTVVKFNFENEEMYVNSEKFQSNPYKGDVINIFNGEVNEELDRNWPFYELEFSSSAKELKPNQIMYHNQTIYHFEGALEYLNDISIKVFGVNIDEIKI
ncbi:DUF6786 family protein [Lutibacter sp. TH_r2]|uniref:DUF6786 family protein n=1 Tax=Lutibacter sp. TH_r2 TaxID=3082083 RepID=UPI002954858F|nr:DUF6786 family protein [Lutibacter sp. TH_r2]MDV7188228.1 DUF6786 family protein [Lutibacter sp. TH_r2]